MSTEMLHMNGEAFDLENIASEGDSIRIIKKETPKATYHSNQIKVDNNFYMPETQRNIHRKPTMNVGVNVFDSDDQDIDEPSSQEIEIP